MNSTLQHFKVGQFTCTLVSDGAFAYTHPAAVFFAGAPPAELDAALHQHQLDPATWDHYRSPYPSLLIDTGQQRLLVDTGAGNLGPDTGQLLPNLRATGIAPESIDTVILTHGHADHIGGNVTGEGKLTFPQARYVMWQAEWEFWTQQPDLSPLHVPDFIKEALIGFAQRNLPPIADRLTLINQETEIAPGIAAIAAPGHTTGRMALSITSAGEQLLHLVDTVIHPIHLEHPEWVAAVDLLPAQTVATRRRLLQRAVDEQALVLLFHNVESPFNAIAQGNSEAIFRDYTEESVLFLPDNTLHGLGPIRDFFATLLATLPADWMADFKMSRQDIDGEVAYIFWQAPPVFPLATDTFVVRNGKIMAQTFAMLTPA